jgi:hypothetical protein
MRVYRRNVLLTGSTPHAFVAKCGDAQRSLNCITRYNCMRTNNRQLSCPQNVTYQTIHTKFVVQKASSKSAGTLHQVSPTARETTLANYATQGGINVGAKCHARILTLKSRTPPSVPNATLVSSRRHRNQRKRDGGNSERAVTWYGIKEGAGSPDSP